MIENNFFFIAKVFFLKASFISALTIAVNIIFFKSIPCCFAHLRFQGICLWHIASWKENENMNELYFVFFVLFWMLLFFIYNVLKRKVSRLLQISSFHKILMFILKKHLALHIGNWVRVCCYIRHICLHLLFCFANLRQSYQGDIPCLMRKKSWRRLYIFLKPRSMKVRYFKLTC